MEDNKYLERFANNVVTALSVSYLATTIAVNALYWIGSSLLETLEPHPAKNTIEAVVLDVDETNVHTAKVLWADVVTEQGDTLRLYDRPRVYEGKFFGNKIVRDLEEGNKYVIQTKGSTFAGTDIIKVEQQS